MTKKQSHTNRTRRSGGRKAKKQVANPAPDRKALGRTAADDLTQPDPKTLIWQVVAMIPAGKVASYGQIAALIGFPSHARYVGATLRNLPKDTKLPWYRVVNASLRISPRGGGETHQKTLLEAEGVTFVGAKIPSAFHWDAQAS